MATATIAFDASDYGGMDFDPRRAKVYATNSAIDQTIYAAGNKQYIGSGNGTIASDGTGSIVVPIPGVGDNPSTWQTTIHFDVPDRNGVGGRRKVSAGPFTITATGTLNSLVEEMPLLPVYASDVLARLDALEVGGGGGGGGSSSLIVLAGGTVDLPNAAADGYLVGYKVTSTATIEGTSFVPGSYIFERDSGVYGGWTYRTLDAGDQVVPAPDAVAPVAGTLASSAIGETAFTLTVTGASDAVALHAAPYSFSTDNGSTWSAYQSSAIYNVTGKTGGTGYQCKHRVKDAAGNVTVGTAITVTTTVASGLPLTDSMTGTNGTLLTAHAPETGGAGNWLKPVGSATLTLNGSGKAVIGGSSSSTRFVQNITALSNVSAALDLTLTADGDVEVGPMVRASANGLNGITFCRISGSGWSLVQLSGGSLGLLGSTVSGALSAGAVVRITVSVTGTTVTSQLQRLSDSKYLNGSGTWVDGATTCTTGTTALAAAGVGVFVAGPGGFADGCLIDNFSAAAL